MPDSDESPNSGPPVAAPVRKRERRHRKRPWLVRYWWALPAVGLVAFIPAIWNWMGEVHFSHDPLPGYIDDSSKIEAEYREFTGKAPDPAALRNFDDATRLMLSGNYINAAILLETTARQLPVPAVFNDLGVLYIRIHDGPHAMRAFRDALARNHDYAPVRVNLKRMSLTEAIDPGSTEFEPNNTNADANAVWLDRPVSGVITPSVGDLDCYWFTTSRPPRDRISIEVSSRSPSLIPRLRLYDETGNVVTGLKEAAGPGMALRYDFSPPPNTLYYAQVDGVSGSSGAYVLTVSSLRAYDVYEPNDTIATASRIAIGPAIDANIMDAADTDFYSVQSPVEMSVTIDVVSRSKTLDLGLGTFASDLHNTGFGPDSGPGEAVRYEIKLAANQIYYVQVFSKNDTIGPYSLQIR